MSVPSYFSPVAKILIQSGYINSKQMQRVFAQFPVTGESLAQGGLSLVEVLESITGQPLPEHLRHHVWRHLSYSSSSFAEELIQSGFTGDQVQEALAATRRSGRPLSEMLESITGRQFPHDLLRQSQQQWFFELQVLYGIKILEPKKFDSTTFRQTKELIETLIPIDICRRYRLLPVRQTKTKPPSVVIAMVDLENLDAEDDLNRILRPRGMTLQRMLIAQEDYQQIISKYLVQRGVSKAPIGWETGVK